MDIYIKPVKKASLSEQNAIFIQDVAEVIAPDKAAEKINKMKLLDIGAQKKANYLVSVTDIIKKINQAYPDATVSNVGAQDTVVQYASGKSKDHPLLKWLKIAFVALVLLTGSSTAIMSFHSDAQIPKVFENYYKIFYGKTEKNPLILDIPYSIGLAVGIIVFFNHFMGKKITDDPTPIEVEMSLYETEVNETMLDILNTQKSAEKGGGTHGSA